MSEGTTSSDFCPYLGLEADRETVYRFGTAENVCHRPEPFMRVSPATQEELCLTRQHATCSVFLGETVRAETEEDVTDAWRNWLVDWRERVENERVLAAGVIAAVMFLLSALLWPAKEPEAVVTTEAWTEVPALVPTTQRGDTSLAQVKELGVVEPKNDDGPSSRVATEAAAAPTRDLRPTPARTETAAPTVGSVASASPTAEATRDVLDLSVVYHVLRPYQSLEMVADLYRTPVDALLALNGLESGAELETGDEVRVPVPPGNAVASNSANADAVIRHVVRPGEYMSDLAMRYGTTVDALRELNPWGGPIGLFDGRVLFIPRDE